MTHTHLASGAIYGIGSGLATPAITPRCILSLRAICRCEAVGWWCIGHGHWHWTH